MEPTPAKAPTKATRRCARDYKIAKQRRIFGDGRLAGDVRESLFCSVRTREIISRFRCRADFSPPCRIKSNLQAVVGHFLSPACRRGRFGFKPGEIVKPVGKTPSAFRQKRLLAALEPPENHPPGALSG